MSYKAQIIGGPHDGAEVPQPTFEFTWVDGKRNFRDAKRGRGLYRKMRTGAHQVVLVYVENSYSRCSKCEAYHSKHSQECSLCGAPLVTVRGMIR